MKIYFTKKIYIIYLSRESYFSNYPKPKIMDGIMDEITSMRALSFALWALGFIKSKDSLKEDCDMEHPGEPEIKKRYAESGDHPDNVAIHYEPNWGNTFYRLSVKDDDGVYHPFASVETRMPTCDMCAPGCFMDVFLHCHKTNKMAYHTVHFDEKIYGGVTFVITKIYLESESADVKDNFNQYVFRENTDLKQVYPEAPVEVAWIPKPVDE